jgi:hypothetical protein
MALNRLKSCSRLGQGCAQIRGARSPGILNYVGLRQCGYPVWNSRIWLLEFLGGY